MVTLVPKHLSLGVEDWRVSKQSYWDKYAMHSKTDGELTLDVAVVRRYSKPSRSGTKQLPPTTLVYAIVGKRLQRQRRRRSFAWLVFEEIFL
jgi:hypothetical protein